MKTFNTKRIQYYLYVDGQYCFYELENLGKASTYRMEELASVLLAVVPDEFLLRMSSMRILIDAGEGSHVYFTTRSHTDPVIFDMLKEKFFEKLFICKADFGTNAYYSCFKHK